MAADQPGACLWPNRSFARTSCEEWSRCAGYTCNAGEGLGCQAHGRAPGAGQARLPAGAGFTSFTKLPAAYAVEGFKPYTERLYSVALARLTAGSSTATFCAGIIVFACVVTSFVLNVRALRAWDQYARSRRLVLAGWFFTFMGPIFVSCMPLRLFMDADGFASAIGDYSVEFKQNFNVDEHLAQSLRLCAAITDGDYDDVYMESLQELTSAIGTVCHAVDVFVPQRIDVDIKYDLNLPCIANVNVDFHQHHDFTPIHRACGLARSDAAAASSRQALVSTKAACRDFGSLVAGTNRSPVDLLDQLDSWMGTAQTGAEIAVSLVQALASFKILVPAAIAVAPAVIKGAFKVKTLVPESSIPGMFIILLPWVYCPIVWCFCSIFFQLLGNYVVLFGLILAAYAPMAYFVVGMWKRVTMPMTDEVMSSVLFWIQGYSTVLTSMAYAALLYGLLFGDLGPIVSRFADHGIDIVGRWPMLLHLGASAVSKMLFTSLAGFDFMLSLIVESRRSETGVFSKHMTDEDKQEVARVLAEKQSCLDDMCSVYPSPFDDDRVGARK